MFWFEYVCIHGLLNIAILGQYICKIIGDIINTNGIEDM